MVFDVVDGPADDQHVRIDATLYVPSGATPATPAPVVVDSPILAWWDRWLAGDGAIDTGPGFETFLGQDGDRPV